eukprot:tig00000692_g3236.t1
MGQGGSKVVCAACSKKKSKAKKLTCQHPICRACMKTSRGDLAVCPICWKEKTAPKADAGRAPSVQVNVGLSPTPPPGATSSGGTQNSVFNSAAKPQAAVQHGAESAPWPQPISTASSSGQQQSPQNHQIHPPPAPPLQNSVQQQQQQAYPPPAPPPPPAPSFQPPSQSYQQSSAPSLSPPSPQQSGFTPRQQYPPPVPPPALASQSFSQQNYSSQQGYSAQQGYSQQGFSSQQSFQSYSSPPYQPPSFQPQGVVPPPPPPPPPPQHHQVGGFGAPYGMGQGDWQNGGGGGLSLGDVRLEEGGPPPQPRRSSLRGDSASLDPNRRVGFVGFDPPREAGLPRTSSGGLKQGGAHFGSLPEHMLHGHQHLPEFEKHEGDSLHHPPVPVRQQQAGMISLLGNHEQWEDYCDWCGGPVREDDPGGVCARCRSLGRGPRHADSSDDDSSEHDGTLQGPAGWGRFPSQQAVGTTAFSNVYRIGSS